MHVVNHPCTFLHSIRLWVVDCPTQMTVDLWQMTKNTAGLSGHWTKPVTFWLQLLFLGRIEFIIFFRRVDCIKFPQKLGQEISSIQLGYNSWSTHCSAPDNMTLHKLQINRFEVEVESVLFPDFVLLARNSVDNEYGRDRLACFSLSHTLKAIATPFSE